VQISCFALPDIFLAILRVPDSVFIFCASKLILGGTEGVGFSFHILRIGTRFGRYRGCLALFSCCALPKSFSTVPRVSSLVFMCCTHRLIFGGSEGIGSRFIVFCSRTHFRQ
jgi:hypothetical protein